MRIRIHRNYTNIIVSIIMAIMMYNCKNDTKIKAQANGFVIQGTIEKLEDSSLIYLSKHLEILDSAIIKEGKFLFTGNIEEPALVNIRTNHPRQGLMLFYLENDSVSIHGHIDSLIYSTVNGGKTQNEYQELRNKEKPINKEFDKIYSFFEKGNLSEREKDSLGKLQNALLKESYQVTKNFIRDHPDSQVSIDFLKSYMTAFPKDTVSKLYEGISERLKASEAGKEIFSTISLPDVPRINEKFVDIIAKDTTATITKLSDHLKNYTLVEFWASWCAPCIQENPELIKTYNDFKNKGFEIFAVSLDEKKEHWLKAIKNQKLPWIQVSDLKGSASKPALIYGINMIPNNVLIDKNGIIIAKNLRGQQLKEKLAELLPDDKS